MKLKRCFDCLAALAGLIILAPVFALVALWIKYDSPGPVFFFQSRVGQYGALFRIIKFRTMACDTEQEGALTLGRDSRITHAGEFLRRYKIDELPQLINVALGAMSLVGPRPEVPRYVAYYPKRVRELVLSVPPGITDWASIEYKDEQLLLTGNAEQTYIEHILPVKLGYYIRYVTERTFWIDLKIIFNTLAAIVR